MFMYYDIFESDGEQPRWFVGTVRVIGKEDNLVTRVNAVRKARGILKCGFKLHTSRSTEAKYKTNELRGDVILNINHSKLSNVMEYTDGYKFNHLS
jgi:hypothetical protein